MRINQSTVTWRPILCLYIHTGRPQRSHHLLSPCYEMSRNKQQETSEKQKETNLWTLNIRLFIKMSFIEHLLYARNV